MTEACLGKTKANTGANQESREAERKIGLEGGKTVDLQVNQEETVTTVVHREVPTMKRLQQRQSGCRKTRETSKQLRDAGTRRKVIPKTILYMESLKDGCLGRNVGLGLNATVA